MELPRQIETPRLLLREPRAGDAPAAHASYAGDPTVLRYVGWRRHESVEETREQLGYEARRWQHSTAFVWVLSLKAAGNRQGQVFGQIELMPQCHPLSQSPHLRLGYLMGTGFWGQGYMSEAVRAVLQAAMRQEAVWRVDALCDVDNHASAALLARVGMRREGLMRRAVMHPNVSSQPRDAWLFAITRDDALHGVRQRESSQAGKAQAAY